MADTSNTILVETVYNGFALDSSYGVYAYHMNPAPFVLEVGMIYTVVWDGTEYTCPVYDLRENGGFFALGNVEAFLGTGDTGEPFIIGWAEVGVSLFSFDDSTTHTLAIYLSEAIHNPNDVVILNYSQNPVEYKSVPKVWLTHPDSTEEDVRLVPFTYGEAVSKSIEPDFSGGNMAVPIADGELVTELTLVKPDTLLPENIRNGKEVAGVKGDFIGDTEELTVDLDFANGNQVISPSTVGKVISQVTIQKPEALTPENIAKDVEIAGVVGTLEAETEEGTVNLDFSGGAMEVTPTEGKTFSKVNIPVPETLIPENIAEGVTIAGIGPGTHSGGGGEITLEGDFLKYCLYQIDTDTMELTIYKIWWQQVYAQTGSYDLDIPGNVGGFTVVIYAEGVS